jgi:CheY-like chemotaxis protein
VDAPIESLKQRPDDVQLPPGKETILVVEDEKTVCEITVKILSDCGYNIIMTKNGEEALALWEKNKNQVDLLLTDIVLPGISGLKLAQRLLASKPELKVIYMSGYSEDVIAHYGSLDNDISLIQKPFTSMILTKKVREVLK